MNTSSRSKKLFARATQILPGGVDSPVRAFQAVGGSPLFIKSGAGAIIQDVDGNRFIDYVMSWGPLIHGHAPRGLVQSITAAARRGTSFGAPSPGFPQPPPVASGPNATAAAAAADSSSAGNRD